jgi:hypothetical protein
MSSPSVNGFGGLKTELIRLRVISRSQLRSRERVLPEPSLVDVCLPGNRELLSRRAPKKRSPSSQDGVRCLHFPNSKFGRDVASHLYIIGGATLRR